MAFIVLVSGGVIKQGTVNINVLTQEEFKDSLELYERFYSRGYIGWSSPIIKEMSIQEIKNNIKKVIGKSNDETCEENKSIKEDDDNDSKEKKSRFIEDSDYLYNFNITKIKQLLMKEFDFKSYTCFNKKEKEKDIEVKKNVEEDIEVKKTKIIKKKTKKDTDNKVDNKVDNNKVDNNEKLKKDDKIIKAETVYVFKDTVVEKKEIKKKKPSEPKVQLTKNTAIKIKPVVKKLDSDDSDDSQNVAEISDTDSNDSD